MLACCGSFRSHLREAEYRRKFLHTLCLFFTFITLGICVAQTGPALLDLQLVTNTNTQQASVFLTGNAIGSMVGCLLMGLVLSRINRTVVMALCILCMAVVSTGLPWSSSYVLMIAMHGLVGVFKAILSAGGNSDLIRTWEAERRVFLQILHFCFAAGSTIGPMITEPFLSSKSSKPSSTNGSTNPNLQYISELSNQNLQYMPETANETFYKFTITTDVSSKEDSHTQILRKTKVHFAYLITGVLCLTGFFFFIIQYFCFTHKERPREMPVPQNDQPIVKPLPFPIYVITLAFILLFLFFLIGVETSVSSFLVTFAVNQLNWTKETGAELTSVFWGCYAAWRFATIFFTDYIPPFVLLIISSCALLLSTIGILLTSVYHIDIGIWICIGISGLALSSQYPSMMMWAEESIMRLTAGVISLVVMACTLPGMVIPLLIGYQMQNSGPVWLFYIVTMMCGFCLVLLVALYVWSRCVVQPKTKAVVESVNI